MSQNVFACGSNMCSGRLRDYGVSPEGTGRAAVLTGYRLLFNKKSTKDNSGKANVDSSADSQVWGVLYTISDSDLRTLDSGEDGYRPVLSQVQTLDGVETDAWVYIASAPDPDPNLRPYTWYKRFLVEGATEHVLPAHYIAALEQVVAIPDPNASRDREKRSLECRTRTVPRAA
jgi:hypothetical protein